MKIYIMVQIIYVINVQLIQHLNLIFLNIIYHLNNVNDQDVQQLNLINDFVIDDWKLKKKINKERKKELELIFVFVNI